METVPTLRLRKQLRPQHQQEKKDHGDGDAGGEAQRQRKKRKRSRRRATLFGRNRMDSRGLNKEYMGAMSRDLLVEA